MITYVDTSVVVKLMLAEAGTRVSQQLWDDADAVTSTVLIGVEARAALAAARRDGRLNAHQLADAKRELSAMLDELASISVTDTLVGQAGELAELHALGGYDAVHLAAAMSVRTDLFASSDRRLCAAAGRVGMLVVNPAA